MSEFEVDSPFEGQWPPRGGELSVSAGQGIPTPALFAAASQSARRFWEFFNAEIPNDNTRKAYFCAIRRFDGEQHKVGVSAANHCYQKAMAGCPRPFRHRKIGVLPIPPDLATLADIDFKGSLSVDPRPCAALRQLNAIS